MNMATFPSFPPARREPPCRFGRDGHSPRIGPDHLVATLYDELMLALTIAAKAGERGNDDLLQRRRERALALLGALESGLNRGPGGPLADALARVYRNVTDTVRSTPANQVAAEFTRAHDWLAEIAAAWSAID